ncbi:hypothetical protein [Wukongibacter sp. M2B1]|uniref:hypothetical protein n=1 Tax=Wukongibacter sp. M2B1 TaxID=3088895 RepID=UPI003D7A42DD
MNQKTISLIVAILIVGVGLAAYPVIKNNMIIKDPINHIMYSCMKTSKEKNLNANLSVKVEIDEKLAVEQGEFDNMSQNPDAMAAFINSLLKNFEILYDINMITDDSNDLFKMNAGIDINYSEKTLIDGDFNLEPWELGIKLPKLYKKSLYIDINEVINADGNDINLYDIDFKAYLDLLQKEDELYEAVAKNYQPYKDIIYNYLQGKVEKLDKEMITLNVYGEDREIEVTKYRLNINLLDIYDVYGDLLEVVKNDEAVKALLQSRIKEFKDLVIKNRDYEKFGLTEKEFTKDIKAIEDRITNNWDEEIDTMITEFKSISNKDEFSNLEDMIDNYTIAIDKNHLLRQVELDIQSQFIKIKEVISCNAFGKNVKVNSLKLKDDEDKINLLNIKDDEVLTKEIGQEVVINLLSQILGGEAVEALLADIKAESKVLPANESKEIINNVDDMFNQMKMYLPLMLKGMGLEND